MFAQHFDSGRVSPRFGQLQRCLAQRRLGIDISSFGYQQFRYIPVSLVNRTMKGSPSSSCIDISICPNEQLHHVHLSCLGCVE